MLIPLLTAALAVIQAAPAPAPGAERGTIAVTRPAPENRRPAPTLPFAEALESALVDGGYTALPDTGNARQVATIAVERTVQGSVMAKGSGSDSQSSGGMLGGNGVGVGMSVGLGSGGARVGALVTTALTVRLTRRGEAAPYWEGRMTTNQIAGSRGDAPDALATKLAAAMVRNLDQPSGVVASVP